MGVVTVIFLALILAVVTYIGNHVTGQLAEVLKLLPALAQQQQELSHIRSNEARQLQEALTRINSAVDAIEDTIEREIFDRSFDEE